MDRRPGALLATAPTIATAARGAHDVHADFFRSVGCGELRQLVLPVEPVADLEPELAPLVGMDEKIAVLVDQKDSMARAGAVTDGGKSGTQIDVDDQDAERFALGGVDRRRHAHHRYIGDLDDAMFRG